MASAAAGTHTYRLWRIAAVYVLNSMNYSERALPPEMKKPSVLVVSTGPTAPEPNPSPLARALLPLIRALLPPGPQPHGASPNSTQPHSLPPTLTHSHTQQAASPASRKRAVSANSKAAASTMLGSLQTRLMGPSSRLSSSPTWQQEAALAVVVAEPSQRSGASAKLRTGKGAGRQGLNQEEGDCNRKRKRVIAIGDGRG